MFNSQLARLCHWVSWQVILRATGTIINAAGYATAVETIQLFIHAHKKSGDTPTLSKSITADMRKLIPAAINNIDTCSALLALSVTILRAKFCIDLAKYGHDLRSSTFGPIEYQFRHNLDRAGYTNAGLLHSAESNLVTHFGT